MKVTLVQITSTLGKSYIKLTIKKNQKFRQTAGIQCTTNVSYTISFPALKNVSIWAYFDLDYTIDQRDEPLAAVDELTLSVKLEGCDLEVTTFQHYSNRFSRIDLLIDDKKLSTTVGHVTTCARIDFGLIWRKNINFFI